MGFSKQWYEDLLSREAAKAAAKQAADITSVLPPDDGEEDQLQEKIAGECIGRSWYFVRSRMDRKTTVAIGTPDFIIFPFVRRAFVVECKSGKKKLTTPQLGVQHFFMKLRQPHYVVRSFAEFLVIAKEYE